MFYFHAKNVIHTPFRGKMGASLHRSLREQAIGGRPPYLMVKLNYKYLPVKVSVSLYFTFSLHFWLNNYLICIIHT